MSIFAQKLKIMNNWIYIAVFLDDESKNKLIELNNKITDSSWKIYCHHMTIAFNDKSEDMQNLYESYKKIFGKEVILYATHFGISDTAIAVKVATKINTTNKIPHITLSTPIGGKPVNSNYINNWVKFKKPIELKGKIGAFKKSEKK